MEHNNKISKISVGIVVLLVAFIITMIVITNENNRKQTIENINKNIENAQYLEAYHSLYSLEYNDETAALMKKFNQALENDVRSKLDNGKYSEAWKSISGIDNPKLEQMVLSEAELGYYALIKDKKLDEARAIANDIKELVLVTDLEITLNSDWLEPGDKIANHGYDVKVVYSNGTSKELENDAFSIVSNENTYIENTVQTISFKDNNSGFVKDVKVNVPIKYSPFKNINAKSFATSVYESAKVLGVNGYSLKFTYDNNGKVTQASFQDSKGRYPYFLYFTYFDNELSLIRLCNNVLLDLDEMEILQGTVISKTIDSSIMFPYQAHQKLGWNGKLVVGGIEYRTVLRRNTMYSSLNIYDCSLTLDRNRLYVTMAQ